MLWQSHVPWLPNRMRLIARLSWNSGMFACEETGTISTSKMANRTVSDAKTVKGTNPQYLVEKIIRSRIYENKYWKEQCFALSGEVFERAVVTKLIILLFRNV